MSFVRIDDIDIYYELNGDKGKDVILYMVGAKIQL